MKKQISKIIAIVCLIAMMSAMAACTQTIQIAFVDANGDVYNPFENIGTGTVNVYAPGGASGSGTAQTPAANTPATNPAPAADTPAPAADGSTAPTADNSTAPAANPAPTGAPATKDEIIAFYAAAANKIKNEGVAGFTKKEWQTVSEINVGPGFVNEAIVGVVGNFMTAEADAEEQINEKGSDDAKNRFSACNLTDNSFIVSAECTTNGAGNYVIKMVCADEDTPKKDGSSKLSQITQSVLYWEDIEQTLTTDPTVTKILTGYDGVHVVYKGYQINCEITPDGQFVSVDHIGNIDIAIGSAKILVVTIKDKSAHLVNTCKYYNFKY